TDGSRLRVVPSVAVPGSHVVPTFQLSGRGTDLLTLNLPGTAKKPVPGFPITEVFFVSGARILQLTNFGRDDTGGAFVDVTGRRGFVTGSVDRFGKNPTENCQLFAIDDLGGHLRQLTHFTEGEHSANGCFGGAPPGCGVGAGLATQDLATRTV